MITINHWACEHGACAKGLRYTSRRRLSWKLWAQASGDWRMWACRKLQVKPFWREARTSRNCLTSDCDTCNEGRKHLNKPQIYAALKRHWETVVLPAFQKAGVR